MTFSLVGSRGKEAFDEETGILIKSRGARGPEIENNHWEASVGDLCFEFSSRIGNEGEDHDGTRKAYLSPPLSLIDYLKDGGSDTASRKALVDRMVEGIVFLTPIIHFKLPVTYFKRHAITAKRVGDRVAFGTVDAPGLWDAGSIVR